jgi:hypothetical protein
MKKMVLLGLVFILSLVGHTRVYAREESETKNVLDLRNLVVLDGMAMTKDHIVVEEQAVYTLVMSAEVLGNHYVLVETMELVITDDAGSMAWAFQKDEMQKKGYVEFETRNDRIQLKDIPIDPQECYQVMLFKGNYADYSGFEPFYTGNSEVHGEETIEIPYETELSLADIENLVSAYGPDHEQLDYMTIKDEYSTGNKMPGTYVLSFESIHQGVISTFDLFIRIVDDQSPTIICEPEYVFEFADRPTIAEMMERIMVQDNVDELGSEDLYVVSDTYTDAAEPGTYEVVLKAIDSSGNEAVEDIQITLLDSMGPIVEGTDILFVYTEDEPLSHDDILAHYHVYDEVDGDDVYYGIDYDTYQGTRIPGVYTVSIRAIDRDGNQTTHYIEIHVVNNSPVRFEIGDVELLTTTHVTLSEDDLIAFMDDTLNDMGYEPANLTITYDDYSGNAQETGTYYVYFDYEIDEKPYQTRLSVSVEDEEHGIIAYVLVGIALLGGFGIWMIRRRR